MMDYNSFAVIMGKLRVNYDFFAGTKTEEALSVWYSMLKNIDGELLNEAVEKWIMTETKAPNIADLRNAVYDLKCNYRWDNGWATTKYALNKWGNSKETMDYIRSKDDIAHKVVKTISLWSICSSDDEGYTRNQFKNIYESLAEERRKEAIGKPNCGIVEALTSGNEERKMLND